MFIVINYGYSLLQIYLRLNSMRFVTEFMLIIIIFRYYSINCLNNNYIKYFIYEGKKKNKYFI